MTPLRDDADQERKAMMATPAVLYHEAVDEDQLFLYRHARLHGDIMTFEKKRMIISQ